MLVVHHRNPVVVDNNFLDYMADNLLVDSEVDNMLEDLRDNIAVVEEVDHNLVVHKHLQLVLDHLVADNN
jgi:rRNA-processing protein FCF1